MFVTRRCSASRQRTPTRSEPRGSQTRSWQCSAAKIEKHRRSGQRQRATLSANPSKPCGPRSTRAFERSTRSAASRASPERDASLARLEAALAQLNGTYIASLQSYQQALLAQASRASTINLIEPAIAPETPVRPNRTLVVALAALAGLAIVVVLAALHTYLISPMSDDTLHAATGLTHRCQGAARSPGYA